MQSLKVIRNFRQELDKTTKALVRLISERKKIVFKIGKIKRKLRLRITDASRDKEVLKEARLIARKEKVDPKIVEKIMKTLIKYAKEIQKNQR